MRRELEALANLANRLDELAEQYDAAGEETLLAIVESEQRRLSRVRRLAIAAHQRVWG